MSRHAAATAFVVLTLAGCTQGNDTGATSPSGISSSSGSSASSTSTPASPSESSSQSSSESSTPPAVLAIPPVAKGEISRTVLQAAGSGHGSNRSTIGDPVKGREYVVRSACVAPVSDVTITYRLVDARASSSNRTREEQTVMSSQTPCDGTAHMDGIGSLGFPVTVEYDGTANTVATAYTIVAPQ